MSGSSVGPEVTQPTPYRDDEPRWYDGGRLQLSLIRTLTIAALVLSFASCQPRTEIVIGFATDYKAPSPLDEIKLTVVRQDGFAEGGDGLSWMVSGAPDQPYNLPASYGVYSDGEDVQLDVTLAGFSNGNMIVSQEVTLSLVGNQTLFYRMGLTAECEPTTCGSGTTCMEGTCVAQAVPVSQLPKYEPDLVTTLTCTPPSVHYIDTATDADMPYSANAASCPSDLCVQGVCLTQPSTVGGPGLLLGSALPSGVFAYTQGSYLEGFEFKANTPIKITQLGYYDSNLTGSAETFAMVPVGVYDMTTSTLLGSNMVSGTDPATGIFRYHPLTSPIAVNTSDTYAVVAVTNSNYYGAEYVYDNQIAPGLTWEGSAGYGADNLTMTTMLVLPNGSGTTPGDIGPNFIFEPN